MDFDEQSDFPVAMNAPRRFNEIENGIDSSPAPSLETRTSVRLDAHCLARTKDHPAAMIFSLKYVQRLAARSATPLPSASTIH
jgi:hypothetical protein